MRGKMTIQVNENTLWVGYTETNQGNWIGAINKVDDGFDLTYRWRYYEDDKSFDSKDRKSWYSFVAPPSVDPKELIDTVHDLLFTMAGAMGKTPYEAVRGDRSYKEFSDDFEKFPNMKRQRVN
jgi:hypothetical protein